MGFYRRSNNVDFKGFDRKWIMAKAEASLMADPVHITDAQASMSEGGPHDFYSNGDYWWPNPDTKDGLPYIRRDGESNPDCFSKHRKLLRKMRTNVANLAAGYKISGNEKFACKAVLMLKEFFLDESTFMNPNLLFAQAIPGLCSGRGIGIIDTIHLIDVPLAIRVLRHSPCMKAEIYSGLKRWFADYLKWMTTHPYGIEEMNAKNNHGVCWLVQAAVFAYFTDNHKILDFCRSRYKKVLLPEQMTQDGGFPLELARTKPYGYSIFVLDNMVTLCQVLSTGQDCLWDFKLKDGRSISKGLEFLYPYLEDKSRWLYDADVEHFDGWPVRMSFMLFAGLALGERKYLDLWYRLDPDPKDEEIRRNMAIRQPILWVP
ncbi:MAG: alginate lyase family protein [Clostridiales bacterium]|nr:alginate lyase family protein [Clostridiales bacterium]